MSSGRASGLCCMSITEILDAVAPGEDAQALALMLVVAACEQASTLCSTMSHGS
jgi:hypothetical protein